ncbi:MAG: nuclear transport factor 2 family protein [Pseudomonadota bacterium]
MNSTADTQRLLDSAHRDEIRTLSALYMRGLDRLDPATLRSVFWPDAWLAYGIYEGAVNPFVDFCMQALATHDANQHLLGQITVELDGDQAFGEVYYQAYHRTRATDGAPRDLLISGRYVDRYELREDRWRIAWRSELVDWTRDDQAADDWFADSLMIRGDRAPRDPLYQRDVMQRRATSATEAHRPRERS